MARRMTASGARQGVRSEDYWEWRPGQRVQTQDGLLGTVEAVEDGPFPQTEQYAVIYDGDLGHGWHMAGQLRSVGARESEGGLGRTVASEYPGLAGAPSGSVSKSEMQLTADWTDGVEKYYSGMYFTKDGRPIDFTITEVGNGFALKAKVDGKRAGYLMSQQGVIAMIEVRPEFRRMGVGTALMSAFIEMNRNEWGSTPLSDDGWALWKSVKAANPHFTEPQMFFQASSTERSATASRDAEAGLGRTVAAEDYPELSGVVEEWPSAEVPIEGKRAARSKPVEGDVVVAPDERGHRLVRVEAHGHSPLGTVRGSRDRALARAASLTDGAVWVDEAEVLLRTTSSEVPVSIGRKPTSSEVATSSEVRTAFRGPAEWLADSLDEYGEQFGVEYHNRPSVDWCRYRANSQCYYPRRLDAEATAQYKTPIFIAESRGYCERSKWKQQQTCPMAWPETRTHDSRALPQFYDPDNPSADPLTRAASLNAEGIRLAAWADVRSKANRLRSDGAISIVSVTDNQVAATVRGDNGTYTTVLTLEPGTKRVAIWECECEWAKYAWGRSGRWKKLEGRMCAHALGTLYEVQSRSFGGRTVEVDEEFIRGAALVSVSFPALVNGVVQYVTSVDPDASVCVLTDGSEAPIEVVEYHLWHPTLGLSLPAHEAKVQSVIHDEPQAALPQALGADEDDEALFEEPVREAAKVEMAPPKNQQELSSATPAPFAEDVEEPVEPSGVQEVKEGSLDALRPAWLAPGTTGAQASQAQRDADAQSLAAMASAFLKEGVKAFSISEQQELISEGAVTDDGLARNLHRLDLSGTHYESDLGSDLFL